MLNQFSFHLPASIETKFQSTIREWSDAGSVARIWNKDATLWTGTDEAVWLDWLEIVEAELGNAERYRSLAAEISDAGFESVLLMGMGGSSLCPEVLAMTFGKHNFHILDSTVPAQIAAVESKLDNSKTLFIVASKSGSTLEPNCFKQYFFDRVSQLVGAENAGKQFIAITDPGSKMEQVAQTDGFRHIFYGKPQIGGRFSALSAFGMTAAAAMGIDVEQFLQSTMPMVDACRSNDPNQNPGAALGIMLGVCHAAGRDKLTIFTTPEIHDLGAWMEQLVAESTGKIGVAIIPVDREKPQAAALYGSDRIFAFLSVAGNDSLDEQFASVTAAGHPAVRVVLDSIDTLGQEFFRWEFATATAGSIMDINPFNQPDVESAKIEARKITDEYETTGSLPPETPFFASENMSLFTGSDYAKELLAAAEEETVAAIIDAHLSRIGEGDYFGLLGYLAMSPDNAQVMQAIRTSVLERFECATCLGFGPRFLHSTGQAYKGGGNNGVFLQITSDDDSDIQVPGQRYTFGVVKAAQARGDFQVLLDRGRRALRVHVGSDVSAGLRELSIII